MTETRASKYGRALANMLRPTLIFYSRNEALDYVDILAANVSEYSFRKRKVGEPVHEGCRWSLMDIERVDAFDPLEAAFFVRESFDETYNKDRALNMFYSFMDAIENIRDDVIEDTL